MGERGTVREEGERKRKRAREREMEGEKEGEMVSGLSLPVQAKHYCLPTFSLIFGRFNPDRRLARGLQNESVYPGNLFVPA